MNSEERYAELRRVLDADTLIQTAQAQDGLSDWGDENFREPFGKFLDCVARDVDFNDHGVDFFKRDVGRCLTNRLRFQHDLKRHPEILEEDVSDPIIITGLGRSGTTKLQKMLSAPDDVQKMYFWRIWNPARVPGEANPAGPDPRIVVPTETHILSDDKPGLDAAHHIAQHEVDEDWVIFMLTFDEWCWTNMVPSPSYFDWVMQRPSLAPYRYVKTIIQYLQWQDGGKRGRPWIMKGIGYIANMDSLLECYPNATLVHAHRDPRQTIPSYAKFEANVWPIQSKPLDSHFVGRETLRMWRLAMERYLAARDRLKLDKRILDVDYELIRADPMAVMRAVYERAGLAMDAIAEQKMQAWHNSNEQGQFGKHEYSLEEFGLSEAAIDDAFADYIKRFIKR